MSLLPRLLVFCLAWAAWAQDSMAEPAALRLIVPAGYLPGIPTLARVELLDETGRFDRRTWDSEAVLAADSPGVTLSTNRVRMYNGVGTALITVTGSGDFELSATVPGFEARRRVADLSGVPRALVGGELTGTNVTWSGVIQVTNDVTVPAGCTLTVASNTWVLFDGSTLGVPVSDLFVMGALHCEGTAEHPVTFTCAQPGAHWGQIRHERSGFSRYEHAIVTRAGHAPREPHTSTGPAIRVTDSKVDLVHCSVTDHSGSNGQPGKVLQATGSDLLFESCVMARSRMGPEVQGTILVATNTYFLEMTAGIDDEDALYIHYQGPGRTARISDCVVAHASDDGIDMVGSGVVVERCIVRDVLDKGISMAQGESSGSDFIKDCLIVDCGIGISAKGVQTVTARIDSSTIIARNQGIAVTVGDIHYYVTNSIIAATVRTNQSVYSDQGGSQINIFYSNILHTNWPGPGNISLDPKLNEIFRLEEGSPSIDAGDPGSPLDPDGTRKDQGAFPFFQPPFTGVRLVDPRLDEENRFCFTLQSDVLGVFDIYESADLKLWSRTGSVTNQTGTVDWCVEQGGDRFYRAQEQSGE